jgi:hypothetical protein
MAEVGGLSELMAASDQFGVARDDQERGEARRHVINLADREAAQIEFVKIGAFRARHESNPHPGARCMVFSQNAPMAEHRGYKNIRIAELLVEKSKMIARK